MAPTSAPKLKLWYFDFPGRGEATRLLLRYGGVPFEDYRFSFDQWPSVKPNTPFGQIPVLEVDGVKLAQSAAIEYYAAGLAGLLPADPFLAAKTQEIKHFVYEARDIFQPTIGIKDQTEAIKAREEIAAGPLKDKLTKLSGILEANGGEYFVGKSLSYADFAVFTQLSQLVSGQIVGIPTNTLDSFPALKAHHNRIASLPKVAEQYKDVTEGIRLAYKPLP